LAAPAGVGVVSEWPALLGAECDAVIVATPPHTHAEILEGCLEARTPCLIEKPLCLDVATAERLHRLVESSGVPVLVDHTQLFNPAYVALRRALEQAAEPIRLICSEGMALGPFRTHTSALWDWTPHDVSLCLDLLGALPERLDALAGPAGPTGTPEQVSIRLDFPSGAAAWIQAGRLSPQRRRLLSVVTDRQLYVLEDGAAEPLTASAIRWPERYAQGLPDALPRRAIPLPSATPPLAAAVAYFLDGLQGGDRTKFGTELALNVVKVLAACEAAIAERAAARHEPHAVS
jgi:predicted dehydrogenase